MSTSLAEQLRRLQTPQSSQFIDTKKRDSILFTTKEAATKSRETIYEIGLSGLQELIEMNPEFEQFQSTLFELTAKDVQRAVETKEVNALLDKNIKRFMFHLSPYFMIPATHKCLEWLIRRFNINLYNKDEFLMLILPYHQTNMFVRCVQTMKFDDPTSKWDFLSEVKKSSAPLSKYALWNHGATQPIFLGFVGKFTHEAIKELNFKAGSLQTMLAFYCTTMIGAMEQASTINDNHLHLIARYLVKAYKSDIVDFAAAGYMITAQLLVKAKLGVPLLNELMDKITSSVQPSLTQNVVLLLSLMFQSQTDDLRITEKTLENVMSFKLLIALEQMKSDGKPFISFYRALICKLLEKIGDNNDDFVHYKSYCEALMSQVVLEDDEAEIIIRAILDSYILVPDDAEEPKDDKKKLSDDEDEDEGIISLDSDDDEENIPLKSQDVTIWYSTFLKTLERQYPVAFDDVVKVVMSANPGRKRNGLKNVLGFLLKVSCANNDTNIFENLYHHNAVIRTEAVAYLVQNFKKINLTNNESGDILRLTITERLNDDNPNVLLEVLNINSSQLLELVGADELVAKLTKVLMRFWKSPEKWSKVSYKALELLVLAGVHQCPDSNIVLIGILPFLFPSNLSNGLNIYNLIRNSSYGNSSELIKALPKKVKDVSLLPPLVIGALEKCKLPSSESVLATIKNILLDNQKTGSISVQFSFLLLAYAVEPERSPEFGVRAVQVIKEVLTKRKLTFIEGSITDTALFKNQEIPTEAVTTLLKHLITKTKFETTFVNFSHQDVETKMKLEIFQFLVEKFFSAASTERSSFNEVIKVFLDTVCKSNHVTKILFFSQFCASHVVYQDSDGLSLELQIRTMRLLNHVLANNQEHVSVYPSEFFQNVLIALTSEQTIVREFGMEIVGTLLQQKIPTSWKFLFDKLESRKNEILMDNEQLSLIIFLITNKKSSTNLKQIIEGFLSTIQYPGTFDYIRSSLLLILKHLNDKNVVDVMTQAALKLVEMNDDAVIHYDDYQSLIIKLALMKINQTTVSSMWNLTSKSLECHRLLFDDDGKFLTPSILVLKMIDEDVFAKLHADYRAIFFHQVVKCAMNEHPRIVQAANKTFLNINVDGKLVKAMLMNMPRIQQQGPRKKTDAESNPLQSNEWKEGVTLLELLQNKSKGFTNQHELIPLLFDVLDNCLRTSTESNMEYTRQIVLSLLLNICQKVSPDGKGHRTRGIQNSQLKTELVIRCIKESENPQTHHHSLLLLAQLALMSPEQVLNDMMAIFTFVGTTLIRHEDSYSFQIISKIIENVVPTLALGKRGDDDVIPILKIFASIILQVPDHRRLMLYVKLLTTLDVDKYLWMFIGLVMESQVSAHQKGKPQEELPQRVQIALAIAKEFDVKTIVESSTSLIVYLKELPMFLETKPGQLRTTPAEEEKEIFSLKTHTDVQLRHFKYLVLQFLKNLLSSPELAAKVTHLSIDTKMEMKGMFQDIILKTLTLIPEISKALDHQKMKPFEKSWQAILQNSFDILEAAIELLSPVLLLVVVGNLILHEFFLVQKKVIELFNRKLEENYFDLCEGAKLLKLMVPLKTICDSIGKDESNTALEVVQQSALTSIKLLARKLSEENPDEFVVILEQLTAVIDNDKIRTTVLVNLVICVAELTAHLKVRAIGMLGTLMPSILQLMSVRDDDPVAFLLLHSSVSAVLRIIETVPLFLSPYLSQIISQLTRLSPGLKLLQDGKVTPTLTKIAKIWTTLAQLVPTRVLVPAIEEVYERVVHKGHYTSVEPLMQLMYEIFSNADGKEVKSHQSELTEFFVKAMQFRCEVEGKLSISFEEVNDVELYVIRALVAFVMKLSEGSFRPLFESIFIWAIKDEPDNFNRAITFFRWTNEVSAALKSLFLLFSSELIDCAGPMLDKCNPSKHDDDSCFGEDKAKNLYLTEFILRTLNNIFLHDHQNFINTQRFDIIMQPIADQIENDFVLADEKMQQLLQTCVAQLAVAASDDILWKQLNYQVLMKTRSDSANQRIFGLKVSIEMAKKLGEDFEPLIPETIPFLSELLEDEDYKVVEACQNGVRELEATVNESLQKYF